MITNGIAKRNETMVTSSLHVEYITHAAFCQKRADAFHGREDIIGEIKGKLINNNGYVEERIGSGICIVFKCSGESMYSKNYK